MRILLTILICAFYSVSTFTQTVMPKAVLYDDLSIELEKDAPMNTIYEASIKHYNKMLNNKKSAEDFFKKYEKEFVKCEVDFEAQTVTIKLDMNGTTENWTVSKWNNYLSRDNK